MIRFVTLPRPADERARLTALQALGVLETAPEVTFDRMIGLVAAICDGSIAALRLVDTRRRWFKARKGRDADSTTEGIENVAELKRLSSQQVCLVDKVYGLARPVAANDFRLATTEGSGAITLWPNFTLAQSRRRSRIELARVNNEFAGRAPIRAACGAAKPIMSRRKFASRLFPTSECMSIVSSVIGRRVSLRVRDFRGKNSERFDNPTRRRCTLGYLGPMDFERRAVA